MKVYKYRPEEKDGSAAATSAGLWSGNTESLAGGMCYQVLVKAGSEDTVFDLAIIDNHDVEVRKFTDITEVINDLTPWLAKGVHTVKISDATKDEDFTVLLCFRDI
ncbi:hypothetical protein ACFL3R_00565 [Thermodesulfobacteriota bacterium]